MQSFKFALFASLIASCYSAFGQSDYVLVDSGHFIQGTILDNGIYENNRSIQFGSRLVKKTYHPKDLIEFGFEDNVYIKKEILENGQLTPYFLLRVVSGPVTLFAFQINEKKSEFRFFGETKGEFLEIKKDSLQSTLSRILTNCDSMETDYSQVKYTKPYLSKLVRLHNSCINEEPGTFSKGFLVGYSKTKLTITDSFNKIQASDWSPFFGAFIEFPISRSTRWFMNVQTYFQQNTYNPVTEYGTLTRYYFFKTSSLYLPLSIKYNMGSARFKKFISCGPVFAFNLKGYSDMWEADEVGNAYVISHSSTDPLAKIQFGTSASAGFEFRVTKAKSIGFETRYNTGKAKGGSQSTSSLLFTLWASL